MSVQDVLTTTVVTATADNSFEQFVDIMLHNGLSGIPVVGSVTSCTVTEADLALGTASALTGSLTSATWR